MIDSDPNPKGDSIMAKALTPKALAEEIGVDPKSLRGYLRTNFPRPAEAKNTSWIVPAEAAKAARAHYAKQKATAPAPKPQPNLGARFLAATTK